MFGRGGRYFFWTIWRALVGPLARVVQRPQLVHALRSRGDAGEMRARCGLDAGEMEARCGRGAGEMRARSAGEGSPEQSRRRRRRGGRRAGHRPQGWGEHMGRAVHGRAGRAGAPLRGSNARWAHRRGHCAEIGGDRGRWAHRRGHVLSRHLAVQQAQGPAAAVRYKVRGCSVGNGGAKARERYSEG